MIESKVTDDIELVLVNDSFVPEYVELARKDFEYLAEWLEWPRFCTTADDFGKFVSESITGYQSGETMNCAIRYKGAIVGVAGFNKIDTKLERVEIGYWLGSAYQKKGIATLVCRHLIQYAFTKTVINKIQISVAADNLPSRTVCERLEMKLEGIISNEERIGDKVLSHAIYALHRE
jgi:ribosomal-protein-serine acetyltransferase